MAVDLLPFARFSHLVFRNEPGTNPVRLGDLWQREGDRFLADAADPEGAILYRRADWWHALHNRPEALAALLATLPDEPEPRFAALPPHQWDQVRERWPGLYFNVHLTLESEPGPPALGIPVRSLEEKDAAFLMEHQPYVEEYGGLDYLLYRIRTGLTAGVEVDGGLAGWEVFQDDGTLGFLRVLEPFRGRGYAGALHAWLAARVRGAGWKAISHVSAYNRKMLSIALPAGARKIGEVAWARRRTAEEIARLEQGLF